MEYKNRAKNRKIKKNLEKIIEVFSNDKLNLRISQKIILSWVIISMISLFLPWVKNLGLDIVWKNWFSSLTWGVWFMIFIYLIFLVVNTTFVGKKEKIKLCSGLHFKNHSLTIVLWIFTMMLWISSVIYIIWLQTFIGDVTQGKGIWLCITWSIIIIIWWIIQKREFNSIDINSYTNESNDEDSENIKKEKKENNMKLPF